MSSILFPILIIVALPIIFYLSYYYSNKSRILRELKTSRRKNISSVRQNEYAKIVGKAKHANEPLIAPLSDRKCVYYHVLVERKGDKSWHKVIEDIKIQDFFIECKTELAIVRANFENKDFMRVHLVTDHEENSGFLDDATGKLESYLSKHNKSSTGFLGLNKTLRYKESIIALDENIAVKGIAKWKELNQDIDGYSFSRILTLEGSAEQRLIITDEPEALEKVDLRR